MVSIDFKGRLIFFCYPNIFFMKFDITFPLQFQLWTIVYFHIFLLLSLFSLSPVRIFYYQLLFPVSLLLLRIITHSDNAYHLPFQNLCRTSIFITLKLGLLLSILPGTEVIVNIITSGLLHGISKPVIWDIKNLEEIIEQIPNSSCFQ